jgi:hypothetical protein
LIIQRGSCVNMKIVFAYCCGALTEESRGISPKLI